MVIIRKTGPRLSVSQIADLESRIGTPLPDQYRQFLLENNGGRPAPDIVDVDGIPGASTDLQVFFGISRDIESSNIDWNIDARSDQVDRRLLPIACDSGGNIFFVSLTGSDRDSVYYHFFWGPGGDGELHLVATSFASFLEKIRPLEDEA